MPVCIASAKQSMCWSLLTYLAFGGLHEAAHWLAATLWVKDCRISENLGQVGWSGLIQATLGRAYVDLSLADASPDQLDLIRHAGWIFSLLLAVLVSAAMRTLTPKSKGILAKLVVRAAWITALEAITSDLFQFGTQGIAKTTFLCGNFGLILMNDVSDATKPLDLLQKMAEITMMRGAQSGGVVCWTQKSWMSTYRGMRARIVNGKRTDLSKKIRRAIEPKVTQPLGTKLKLGIRTFLGHTRFATSSSKTYLPGTHPHQWTPPTQRKVYLNFRVRKPEAEYVEVENFVTHNGDFDFFRLAGEYVDLEALQDFLEYATDQPRPNTVDSCAIAGMIDLLRTAGCFALSLRFAVIFYSKKARDSPEKLPSFDEYAYLSLTCENCLKWVCRRYDCTLDDVALNYRTILSEMISLNIQTHFRKSPLRKLISFDKDMEEGRLTVEQWVEYAVHAFFDNDLFHATNIFMENAKGSFGLMVTSSIEASRQICLAARGQPMSIAFYPNKGVVCYGSEQAAVKAGLRFPSFGKVRDGSDETCRFDLDELAGEVCLLDWGDERLPMVSYPNRHLPTHPFMNGEVHLVLINESRLLESSIRNRLTVLENNEFVRSLPDSFNDPVLHDIKDIPRACQHIQDDWRNAGLNRITAWNLSRCLRRRLQARYEGKIPVDGSTVDILLTGCEVSLWLCEEFATDLQKAFPKLFIRCVSSNKLLGVFGQGMTIPAIGSPLSDAFDLKDVIVLIVSHSGGTFAPLACSNLLQSATRNIFVVTSEWDTQVSQTPKVVGDIMASSQKPTLCYFNAPKKIGKQLRSMENEDLCSSRIFSTEIGVRPAEPCSISVVATHQLLTQIFEHICVTILSNEDHRRLSGAVINQDDLRILERCNLENISALESIVGISNEDGKLKPNGSTVEQELREVGNMWGDHVLENVRAYIMSFIYVIGTVTSGYPLVTGLSIAFGVDTGWAFYITRFFDALIYFFLPQVNIIILRLIQKRNLRHRMVGRTVIIGDIPWVAQAADAFFSKLFACSYSIAGLNVLHGNPADHLVHRHTHRIVRGSLLLVGRPDGRLSGLTSAEATVCLSVNQASSIQSLGSTCESITIGHNPSPLSLTARDIFLETHRPQFLCERVLATVDVEKMRTRTTTYFEEDSASFYIEAGPRGDEKKKPRRWVPSTPRSNRSYRKLPGSKSPGSGSFRRLRLSGSRGRGSSGANALCQQSSISSTTPEGDVTESPMTPHRTTNALLGAYAGLRKQASEHRRLTHVTIEEQIVEELIEKKSAASDLRRIFDSMDADGSGEIDRDECLRAFKQIDSTLSKAQIIKIFDEFDVNRDGFLDFDEFMQLARMSKVKLARQINTVDRDANGLLSIVPSSESFFGEDLRKSAPTSISSFAMSKGQHFAMELYESRIASMQRFVAMCVIGHTMAKKVRDFFPRWSCGLFGYNMDRTQSIMRIATTASPVSGADLRERMERLRLVRTIHNSIRTITNCWLRYKDKKVRRLLKAHSKRELQQKQSQGKFKIPFVPNLYADSGEEKPSPSFGFQRDDQTDSNRPELRSVPI